MLWGRGVSIAEITVAPLTIPLREPFVIASGRLDATRAALVRATLEDDRGRRATGLGESAALPPVTREDQPELLQLIAAAAAGFRGAEIARTEDLDSLLAARLPGGGVARAGVETAILDAAARLQDLPLYRALGGSDAPALFTDITLSISDPERMAAAASRHARDGFTCFKVKVGRDWRADCASLRAVAAAVPGARFRLDANAGFTAAEALALLDTALGDGLTIECYEQPCAAGDLAGMAEVTARASVPVVADESFRGPADLDRLVAARAAGAVNLKLTKLGGPLAALALGRRARAAGLGLMAGAMVETRVGLLAMAHVVAALGGVEWVDLDTAFLLAKDPYRGGWQVDGARIRLTDEPGLGVDTE
ncbi:MAG TPA: dipeptide epimerase [Polyangia bacterium]|jgi:L-alanine-DL-glutamate epimerase-like enolase superfamily enzyme|nr:dipeptide epimerase [Polyangia bacterium]